MLDAFERTPGGSYWCESIVSDLLVKNKFELELRAFINFVMKLRNFSIGRETRRKIKFGRRNWFKAEKARKSSGLEFKVIFTVGRRNARWESELGKNSLADCFSWKIFWITSVSKLMIFMHNSYTPILLTNNNLSSINKSNHKYFFRN